MPDADGGLMAGAGGGAGFPALIPPMLAVPARDLPAPEAAWAAEFKWDGVRAVAYVSAGRLRLVSRGGRDMTRAYPELAELAGLAGLAGPAGLAAGAGARQAVLDGEIVAFAAGRPSFAGLQRRMHARGPAPHLLAAVPVTYLAFDIVYLNGQHLIHEPYLRRRAILEDLRLAGEHVHVPPSFPGGGRAVQAVSIQQGLEGVVVKRMDAPYLPGRRSASWLKIKNRRVMDVTVGGIIAGQGQRAGRIGSLLAGVPAGGGLAYAGRVGTGFTRSGLAMLEARLAPLRQDGSPFTTPVPGADSRRAVWVRPELVIEVSFAEWTPGGVLRAAAYRTIKPGPARR
jgi:bifunctional non-homologous end joining protein LigD